MGVRHGVWRENEIAVLRRTERAMVRAMCGAKLMEKKRTEDLMEMLGLKETVIQANHLEWDGTGMCWGGMMGTFWEKRWSSKWRARGSEDDQRRRGRCGEGEQECWFGEKGRHESRWRVGSLQRLLVKWGKSSHPRLRARINLDQNWIDDDWWLYLIIVLE